MSRNMKKLTSFGISDVEASLLVRGAAEGRYHLLTGAGASYGATGGDGEPLLDGKTVANQICDHFKLPLSGGDRDNLQVAYEEAEAHDKSLLRSWIKKRFTKCIPTWQALLFRFRWERIWTFNIDDVMEEAFARGSADTAYKQIDSLDWKSPLKAASDLDTLQLVYLHGRAADIGGRNEGLVFSTPEYGRAARSFQHWHAAFQTHYIERPFIVCGASLATEVDIAEAIRNKNEARASTGLPSFIVTHKFDEAQRNRVRRFNLIPIEADAGEFFTSLLAEVEAYKRTVQTGMERLAPGTFERFLSQFRRLQINGTPGAIIQGSDFYGGDEPIWDDILQDRDVTFRITKIVASLLDINGTRRFAALVHGDPGAGKSASLLRIAKEAARRGYDPYLFREEEGLQAEAVAEYLGVNKKAVLLFDDASSHLVAISRLLELTKQNNVACRIILTLRSNRLRGYRLDVGDDYRSEHRLILEAEDLKELVKKRRQVARLGKHIGKKDEQIVSELQRHCESLLLDCLSYIEFSEGHRARVRKIVIDALTNATQRKLIARISCVHRFGYALPLRAALVASNLAFQDFSGLVGDSLAAEGPIVRDVRGLRLRHRILSEYAWTTEFKQEEKYEAMTAVVNALAPLVNTEVVRARGIEHLILREILGRETVAAALGERALEFYAEHEALMGWSSRYWDQRALLESKSYNNFPKAYSYSQKAISLERHPFAFNSLGSICMDHAVQIYKANNEDGMKYFHEAEEALTQAWSIAQRDGNSHEHPFVTFFASATRMLRNIKAAQPEFEAILALYDIWLQRAKDSTVFSTSFGKRRLQQIAGTKLKEALRLQSLKEKKQGR